MYFLMRNTIGIEFESDDWFEAWGALVAKVLSARERNLYVEDINGGYRIYYPKKTVDFTVSACEMSLA